MQRRNFLGVFPAALVAGTLRGENLIAMASQEKVRQPNSDQVFRKKIIHNGWDIPDTQFMRKNYQQMEKEGPFDGVVYKVRVESNDKVYDSLRTWDRTPWERKSLQVALDDLKSCTWKKFTDNFLRIEVVPGKDDWFDDIAWNAIIDKFGHLAWLAKQGGAKGFQFDPEHYGDGKPFQFNAGFGKTFEATFAKVRERGRQVIKAVQSEFPDMIWLILWITSRQYPYNANTNLRTLLETTQYGLFPAFFNGMLDEAHPDMRFVDGNEKAYYAKDETYFLRAYNQYRQAIGHGGQFIFPENKIKFRRQVEVGSCLYPDMHLNIPSDQGGSPVWAGAGDQYVRKPLPGLSQVETLGEFLGYALSSADEYVWLWGEQSRWWSAIDISHHDVTESVGKGRLWEEALPGISAQIEKVRKLHAAPEPIEKILK